MNIMRKLLRKRVIIPLIILIILGSIGFSIYRYYKTTITGEERFYCDIYLMNNMNDIAEQLDTTVILYYKGNIDEEAYLTQMQMIDDEMLLFMSGVNKINEKANIRVGTHTLASKIGTDDADHIYHKVDNLVDYCMMPEYYSDKDKLVYMYIAQKEQLKDDITEFYECVNAEVMKEYENNKEKYDKMAAEMSSPTDSDE